MLHRAILIAASVVALTATANAADMYRPAEGGYKDVPYVGVNWSGFYAGATAGYAWGQTTFSDNGLAANPFDIKGFTGGGELGYNVQFNRNFVAGVEADISSGFSGEFGPGNLGQPGGGAWNCASGACVTNVNWYGTVRARLGYAIGSTLVFGSGGLAYGEVDSHINNGGTAWQVTNTKAGWAAGGGVEHLFAPNWSGKVEYLHVDLGSTDRPGHLSSSNEFDVVRAGLNYHVGGGYDPLK